MVNTKEKQLDIIESLYPTFDEYANNSTFYHWMDYACELDCIMNVAHGGNGDGLEVIDYLNERLLKLRTSSAEHAAVVDVASNLEEALPEFLGRFKYE